MQLYSSENNLVKKSKVESIKLFFQKIFLGSSATFAVLIPLVIWSEKLNDILGPFGVMLIGIWFISFAGWILFIFLSTIPGKYFVNIYINNNERKKRIGYSLLAIWILILILLIFLTRNNQQSKSVALASYDLIRNRVMAIILVFLLPAAAFLLKSRIFKVLSLIPIALLVVYLLILRPHKIIGNSMAPNLANGQYVLSEKVSYLFNKPKRGDIVIYKLALTNTSTDNIARIVAIPGDKIKIKSGSVYINEKLLVEPYISVQTSSGNFLEENHEYSLRSSQYIVMGDNRFHSADSRSFGSIYLSNIKSKIFYSYWPKDRSGFIKDQTPVLTSNFTTNVTQPKPEVTCTTLGTKMVIGFDNKGKIGCDVNVNGAILNNSYCESQQTHKKSLLIPDTYHRQDRYFATLTGLNLDETVKVYVYSLDGKMVECLPDLNK